jgi:hypothetical protein
VWWTWPPEVPKIFIRPCERNPIAIDEMMPLKNVYGGGYQDANRNRMVLHHNVLYDWQRGKKVN